jgi:metallo-beta-lactamase class B
MHFAMSLLLALSTPVAATPDHFDPLLQPIPTEHAAEWLAPQEPTQIFGNTWLVGYGGLNVALIRTSAGLILIDAGLPQGVRGVEANLRKLGLDPREVKFILSTEPHFDHAGGLAALARDTGAVVVASAAAAPVLQRGRSGPEDPQMAWLEAFPKVDRVRTLGDRESLQLGDTTVTAQATPGHTPGSMSWTWRSCETGKCAAIVFAASLNPLTAGSYRFSDPVHQDDRTRFRQSFERFRTLQCDILLTSHPQPGDGAKLAQLQRQRVPNPFVDSGACTRYAQKYEAALERKLGEESAASSAAAVPSEAARIDDEAHRVQARGR